jgi:hypothetical protein
MKTKSSKLNTKYCLPNTESGFTLLFASLVGALVLAVGMAILSITLKQLTLSSAGKATQQSFYSADAGIECALYLDRGGSSLDDSNNPNCRLGFFYVPSPGATGKYANAHSCLDDGVPESNMVCMGKAVGIKSVDVAPVTGDVTTTFELSDSPVTPDSGDAATHDDMCFVTAVTKKTCPDPSVPCATTIIESRGYNTCNVNAVNRFERAIRSVNQ